MINPPLAGKRIVITRAEEQAGALASQLRILGATPIICPAIAIVPPADIVPLDAAIAQLATYDRLILTSANAVRALFNRIIDCGHDLTVVRGVSISTVGSATAQALDNYGLVSQFIPSAATADALVAELDIAIGQRVLFPCADIARETLPQGLRERGALVDEVIVYRTVPGTGVRDLAQALERGVVDAITFFSPSAVHYLLIGLGEAGVEPTVAQRLLHQAAIITIGPTTSSAVQRAGLRVDATAHEHTSAGVVAALSAWFGR